MGIIREMDGWVESDLSATHLTDGLRNIIVVKVNEGDIIKVKAQSGKAASGALVSTLEITGGHWSALKEDNRQQQVGLMYQQAAALNLPFLHPQSFLWQMGDPKATMTTHQKYLSTGGLQILLIM